jgi:hypothetical protein
MAYMMKRLLAEMKAGHEEMMAEMKVQIDALICRMDARLEGTKDCREAIEASLGKTEAKIETGQKQKEAESKIGLEAVKARIWRRIQKK